MNTSQKLPHEYRIPMVQDYVRSIKLPHCPDLTVIHAFVKIRDLANGMIPDKINPRSHEEIKMKGRIPQAIAESLNDDPCLFHLLNRGCLILAKRAWYNNQTRMLHFVLESEDEHGMVDGATTDRVLARMKSEAAIADFSDLRNEELPEMFRDSYIYLEIIAGEMDAGLRLKLAQARNTSAQVKEFSLVDLGHGFDWLKDVLEKSDLRGRVRYRENEPKSVDIRTVLGLLTLFHPNWDNDGESGDPIVAYTGKERVLDYYQDEAWIPGYRTLEAVVVDILKLYDYIHVNFPTHYKGRLGGRKEVDYRDPAKKQKPKVLKLTDTETRHGLPDGWLYPLLGAFRMLLIPAGGKNTEAKWAICPFEYFDKHGAELVQDVADQSRELGSNPNATGKSRMLWSGLRTKVENRLLKLRHEDAG